ncbi:MAG TPA: hypothetical protein PLV68_18785, partial [Ilumatobacteraceae bacterium]|nr:hypothetical protein [Ilumatobacteraceae bacterium]
MARVGASGVEVDEHEALPDLDRQRRQRELLLVETLGALHRRGTQQAAGEVVAPQVVEAGELGAVAVTFHQLHAAVLADRGERTDRLVLGAGDQNRLAVDGGG